MQIFVANKSDAMHCTQLLGASYFVLDDDDEEAEVDSGVSD